MGLDRHTDGENEYNSAQSLAFLSGNVTIDNKSAKLTQNMPIVFVVNSMEMTRGGETNCQCCPSRTFVAPDR